LRTDFIKLIHFIFIFLTTYYQANITMPELFMYNKEQFAKEVMIFFGTNVSAREVSDFIDDYMNQSSPTFRKSVFRRIMSFKVGNEFWAITETNNESLVRELVAIWKLYVRMTKGIFEEKTVEEFAQEKLENSEKQLEDGIINEQQYIDSCNWIMKRKEDDERIVDCCSCSPIGSMNKSTDDELILRIVCLPCDWNKDAKPVRK
jgi:uncharacterized membrane protein YwzB